MAKTALITGASRGIGHAVALKFAAEGFDVALVCEKNIGMLDEVAAEIKTRALTFARDVSDYGEVQGMVDETLAAFGKVDVLVNNAGISYHGLFNEMNPAEWERLVAVNIGGVLNTTRCVTPGMIARKSGAVVNISSVWGSVGASCEVVYSMTKGAVNAFTRALAKETAPSGVRVNAAALGFVDTSMNNFLTDEEVAVFTENIPMSRAGSSKEAADLVYYLASAESSYVTGQVIHMDGGML